MRVAGYTSLGKPAQCPGRRALCVVVGVGMTSFFMKEAASNSLNDFVWLRRLKT